MSYELRILRKVVSAEMGIGYDSLSSSSEFGSNALGRTIDVLQYRTYGEIPFKLSTDSYYGGRGYGWTVWQDVPIVEENTGEPHET